MNRSMGRYRRGEDAAEVWGPVSRGYSQGLVKRAIEAAGGVEELLDGCRMPARLLGTGTNLGSRETDWNVVDEHSLVFVERGGDAHAQAAVDCPVGYEAVRETGAILC